MSGEHVDIGRRGAPIPLPGPGWSARALTALVLLLLSLPALFSPVRAVAGEGKITVEVREAETGKPVAGARVFVGDGGSVYGGGKRWALPRWWEMVEFEERTDAQGRVSVPARMMATTVAVLAPGRAWGAANRMMGGADSLDIRLKPGGSILVRTTGEAELLDPWIHFRGGVDTVPFEGDRLLLEGMPEGRHQLVVRRGNEWNGEVYGDGDVDVVAGETATLEIPVTAEDRGPIATFTGAVSMGEKWGLFRRQRFRVQSVGGKGETLLTGELGRAGGDGILRGRLPVGRYEIVLEDCLFRETFDVAAPETLLAFEVPDPAWVGVHARLGTDGPVVPEVEWRLRRAAEAEIDGADWNSAYGFVPVAVVPGEYSVRASGNGYSSDPVTVIAAAGKRVDARLNLRNSRSLLIRAMHGESPLSTVTEVRVAKFRSAAGGTPADPSAFPSGFPGEYWTVFARNGQVTLDLEDPGRYRVSIRTPSGWEPAASQDVEVTGDERVVVEFHLRSAEEAGLIPVTGGLVVPTAWPMPDELTARSVDESVPLVHVALDTVEDPGRPDAPRTLRIETFLAEGRWTLAVPDLDWSTEIDVVADMGPLEFSVPAPVTVHLDVVDWLTSEPLENATVAVVLAVPREEFGEQRTVENLPRIRGLHTWRGLPGRREFRVSAKGYASEKVFVALAGDVPVERKVRLKRDALPRPVAVPGPAANEGTASVTVVVRDRDGKPVSGMAYLHRTGSFMSSGPVTTGWGRSLDAGAVTFTGLPAGEYVVWAELRGNPIPQELRSLDLEDDDAKRIDLSARMADDPGNVEVTGVVDGGGRDLSGNSLEVFEGDGEHVRVTWPLKPVPGGATLSFKGTLPPGPWRMRVMPLHWTVDVDVRAGMDPLRIMPADLREIVIRPVAAEDGSPLLDAKVRWHRPTGPGRATLEPVPGTDGVHRIILADGPWEFSVEADHRVPAHLELEAGDGPVVTASPALEAGGSISVTVRRAGGASVQRRIQVSTREGAPDSRTGSSTAWSWTRSNYQGVAVFDGLSPGSYVVELADREDGDPADGEIVEVGAGETVNVEIVLE